MTMSQWVKNMVQQSQVKDCVSPITSKQWMMLRLQAFLQMSDLVYRLLQTLVKDLSRPLPTHPDHPHPPTLDSRTGIVVSSASS